MKIFVLFLADWMQGINCWMEWHYRRKFFEFWMKLSVSLDFRGEISCWVLNGNLFLISWIPFCYKVEFVIFVDSEIKFRAIVPWNVIVILLIWCLFMFDSFGHILYTHIDIVMIHYFVFLCHSHSHRITCIGSNGRNTCLVLVNWIVILFDLNWQQMDWNHRKNSNMMRLCFLVFW